MKMIKIYRDGVLIEDNEVFDILQKYTKRTIDKRIDVLSLQRLVNILGMDKSKHGTEYKIVMEGR